MGLGCAGAALETLTRAIEANKDEASLYLERGRDLIVMRKFEVAERDLKKAVDALPEANCALGFVRYVKAEFQPAREAYSQCANPGVFAYLADHRAGKSAMTRPSVIEDPVPAYQTEIRLPGSVARTP